MIVTAEHCNEVGGRVNPERLYPGPQNQSNV